MRQVKLQNKPTLRFSHWLDLFSCLQSGKDHWSHKNSQKQATKQQKYQLQQLKCIRNWVLNSNEFVNSQAKKLEKAVVWILHVFRFHLMYMFHTYNLNFSYNSILSFLPFITWFSFWYTYIHTLHAHAVVVCKV